MLRGSQGSDRIGLDEVTARLQEIDVAEVMRLEAERRCVEAQRRIEQLERQNRQLEHRLALLMKQLYGRRTEKIDPAQLMLFMGGVEAPEEEEAKADPVIVKAHERRSNGHGRDSFPDHLPRKVIPLEPPMAERRCSVCNDPLCRVTEQVSEKGEYIPGHWQVNQYVRGVWACKKGHGSPLMAPAPTGVIDKSRFEPSVYAHVVTAKYGDHLPLHRQQAIFQRSGVRLVRSTMCDMMRDVAILLAVIHREMRAQLLASRFIQSDDTPVSVLVDDDGPKGKRKKVTGRVWVYIAPDGIVVFDFTINRCRAGPIEFLRGFEGTHLQGDGYDGYDHICTNGRLVRVGCWAHVRRKFVDAQASDVRRTASALWLINWIFRIERLVRDRLSRDSAYGEERALAARRRLATRVIGKLEARLETLQRSPDLVPGTLLHAAVSYAQNQWAHLATYLDDLVIRPDNNASERALRAVVLGRKNYLHLGSPKGGETAAILYSMVASCKALGIDPFEYLRDVTQRLVANRDTPPAELTPWAWRDARAARVVAEVADELAAT